MKGISLADTAVAIATNGVHPILNTVCGFRVSNVESELLRLSSWAEKFNTATQKWSCSNLTQI
jgi:hypothetical protein